ncbi:MAG: hypothetical protein PHQ86_09700 [Dehalococcoidales bacterium]|nr:hypothetical protein [Dehalococcoidales bacterium]
MKEAKYFVLPLMCLVLLLTSGCDFMEEMGNISCESSTNVEVSVNLKALVIGTGYKPSGESYEGIYPNIQVEFQISKTSGDSFTQYRTSNSEGYTDPTNVGYNLRKGQTITVTATTTGTGSPASETITLSYDDVRPYNADEGVNTKYTWDDIITLRMPPGDPDLYPKDTSSQ